MNINDKPMKKSYVELEKDNKELRAKIQKINQIIDSADIKTWGESAIVIRIREVLENG